MKTFIHRVRLVFLMFAGLFATNVRAESQLLKDHDYVAIIGDSITEKCVYSVFIEDYLLACQPAKDLSATQFGYGGEHAKGALARLDSEVIPFKPTFATTCYGMNDGNYAALTPDVEDTYRKSETELTTRLKNAGMRVVVSSPGCVDTDTFNLRNRDNAEIYNKTLGQLTEVAKQVASEQQSRFADIHTPMMRAMIQGKKAYGSKFAFAGGDGIHPSRAGHLVMAYGILKAMGCSGEIGTITLHLDTGQAEATDGHKIISSDNKKVEVISNRYPFCFSGDPKDAASSAAALDLVPFNNELNRFNFVVTGSKSPKLKVIWGNSSKVFTSEQLQKGINLADEFRDNPFSETFTKLDLAVNAKQRNEVKIIKTYIHNISQFEDILPAEHDTWLRLRDEMIEANLKARKAVAAIVRPVCHTLIVEPANEEK